MGVHEVQLSNASFIFEKVTGKKKYVHSGLWGILKEVALGKDFFKK